MPTFVLYGTATVYPRVRDDRGPLGKLELCNLLLHPLVGQRNPFNVQDFLGIPGGMNIRAEPNVALDTQPGQVHHGFMQYILDESRSVNQVRTRELLRLEAYGIPNVVAHEGPSIHRGWFGPFMFGFEVGKRLGLLWLVQGHRFEMEVGSWWIETVDQFGARGDLHRRQWRQRVVCNL